MLMSAIYFWFAFFTRISDELKSRVHSLKANQIGAVFNNTNIFAPNPGVSRSKYFWHQRIILNTVNP